MQENRKPTTYVMSAVSFGDKPAGAIASLALRKTAQLHAHISPIAAKTITENSYVDDIVDSVENTSIAMEITEKAEEILSKGGFHIKEWTVSSSSKNSSDIKKPHQMTKIVPSSPECLVSDGIQIQIHCNLKQRSISLLAVRRFVLNPIYRKKI